jgi:hypothetical protein
MFGIGGLIAPIIVYLFEFHSYIAMGVLMIAISPFYHYLPTPEDHHQIELEAKKVGIVGEI